MIVQSTKPWFSPEDIDKGARWVQDLGANLESQNFGLIFLTPENLGAQWLLFEAGSLSKSVPNSRLCPVLIDIQPTEVTGPLAQFQSTTLEKSDIYRLVCTINASSSNPVADDKLANLFELTWPKVHKEITSLPRPADQKRPNRKTEDILDEVLSRLRHLDSNPAETRGRLEEVAHRLSRLESFLTELRRPLSAGRPREDSAELVVLRDRVALLRLKLEQLEERREQLQHDDHAATAADMRDQLRETMAALREEMVALRSELLVLNEHILHLERRQGAA